MNSPSKFICERLLVAWCDCEVDVLEMESVVSPRDRELKAGDEVTARRKGAEEIAIVVKCYNREILELEENDPETERTEEEEEQRQEENPVPWVQNIQTDDDDDKWVAIGSGTTRMREDQYNKINWKSRCTMATRKLLMAVFSRETLATHTLSGKKSPAFPDKPAKKCLDPAKVSDIVLEIVKRFQVPKNAVRNIITIKCADECKMRRTRLKKKKKNKQPI